MSKNIKRIIAITLSIYTFAAVQPTTYLGSLLSQKASAYTDDETYLSDITLSEGNLNFSGSKTSYTTKVSNSVDEITITAKVNTAGDTVTIDGDNVTVTDSKAVKKVDLRHGENSIKVKVVNATNGPKTYTLTIIKGSTESSTSTSSNNSNSTDTYLDSIRLSDGDISFSKKTLSYNIAVDNNVDDIRITAQPEHDDATVKIGGLEVNDSDKYRTTLSLSKGKNVVKITVEDDHDNVRTYTLNIYKGIAVPANATTEVATDTVDETQGDVYLEDLILEDGEIPVQFKPKVSVYDVYVKDSVDNIIFKAEPQDYSDEVRVNDNTVDSGYKKRVYLNEGKNVVKVKVSTDYDNDDDNEERVYTVNVYRGVTPPSSTSQTQTAAANSGSQAQATTAQSSENTGKPNEWVSLNNGNWQYNDSMGKPLTNNWSTDKNTGAKYYFQANGYMATGWVFVNNNYYYLNPISDGTKGAMKTGWQKVDSNWYYLNPVAGDTLGARMTGWQKVNGTWYYLYDSGVMAANTSIGGYTLDASGAMV